MRQKPIEPIGRTTPETEPLKPERIQRRPESTEPVEESTARDRPEEPGGPAPR